jgi:non-ribosomal peptide synthetase-like protein
VLTDAVRAARVRRVAPQISALCDVPQWCLSNAKWIAAERIDSPLAQAPWLTERSLAYVVFTSGTTGKPKGVMIEHHSIVALIDTDLPSTGICVQDRCGQSSSPAFDSSIEEIWFAFAGGATVVVLDHETVRLGPDLPAWLVRERITTFAGTPTLLRSCICERPDVTLPNLRLVDIGGEMFPLDLAMQWCVGRALYNSYGPTETTIQCFRWRVLPGQREIVIGRPHSSVRAWVLDDELNAVGDGEEGELCLGGEYLARGYLNDAAATAVRFVEHAALGRIYRTGDLVTRNSDGVYKCLGRIDSQVKIRGFRVELEAIEAHMLSVRSVRAAACAVQEVASSKRLVAFIVVSSDGAGGGSEVANAARDAVREALPEYVVPEAVEVIAEIPLTVGGKVDRKRLPLITVESARRDSVVAPSTELELLIAKAVGRVVGDVDVATISVEDDFFLHQAGNSLRAAQLVSLLRSDARTSAITVRDIYAHRTIAALAAVLAAMPAATSAAQAQVSKSALPAYLDIVSTASAIRRQMIDDFGLGDRLVNNIIVEGNSRAGAHPLLVTMAQACVLLCIGWLGAVLIAFVLAYGEYLTVTFSWRQCALLLAGVTFLFEPAWMCVSLAMTVAAKALLIGRYRAGRYPIFGWFYFRHWCVQRIASLMPLGVVRGTSYYSLVLRALGARVGSRVHVGHHVKIGGAWDLLDIGDDVSLNCAAALNTIEWEAGYMIIGFVKVGCRCTLGVNSVVGCFAQLADGAYIEPLASVARGARVGVNEMWYGVPAQCTGKAPDVLLLLDRSSALTSYELPEYVHGLLMICSREFRLVVIETVVFAIWLLVGGREREFATTGILSGIVIASGGVPLYLIAHALALRWFGRTRPGVVARYSLAYMSVFSRTESVEAAAHWISASRMYTHWLRLAGADVDVSCEIDSSFDTLPELLTVGAGSFLAGGTYLACPLVHRGRVVLQRTILGKSSYLGNGVHVPMGTTLPDGVLIGCKTTASSACVGTPHTSWFGTPPFSLPKRDVVVMSRSVTYNPSWRLQLARWCSELSRFVLPPFVALGASVMLYLNFYLSDAFSFNEVRTAFLITPCLLMLLEVCFATLNLVIYRLLLRVEPGAHAFWSSWVNRWDLSYVVWIVLGSATLFFLRGTLFLNAYLRLAGAKIGCRVFFGDDVSQTTDWQLLDIGDDATVNGWFQAHTFEDRVLKLDRVHIGKRATMSQQAAMLYGSSLGDDSILQPHSCTMKGEHMERGRVYVGVPPQSPAACAVNDFSALIAPDVHRHRRRQVQHDRQQKDRGARP